MSTNEVLMYRMKCVIIVMFNLKSKNLHMTRDHYEKKKKHKFNDFFVMVGKIFK